MSRYPSDHAAGVVATTTPGGAKMSAPLRPGQGLSSRDAIEHVVAACALRLVGATDASLDRDIDAILAEMGAFARVERAYLFRINRRDGYVSNSHEWCSAGTEPKIGALQRLALDAFAWPLTPLLDGQVLNVPDVERLPEAAESLRALLRSGAVRAMVNVPLQVAGEVIGFIGFDSLRGTREWCDGEIVLLETIAALLGIALVRRESESAMRHSEARLAAAQRVARLGSWELDLATEQLTWSEQVWRILELDPDTREPSHDAFISAVHPDDRMLVERAFNRALYEQEPYDVVHRLLLPGGRLKYVRQICETSYDPQGKPVSVTGIVHDITRQRQAELLSARLGRILEHSWNEVYVFDAATLRFVEASDGACSNLGYSLDELLRMTPLDLLPDFSAVQLETLLKPLRDSQQQVAVETEQRRKDGSLYPVEMRFQFLAQEHPPVFIAIVQDISERRRYIAELEHKSLYDVLTDLPNRTLLQDRLQQALKEVRRAAQPLALLIVDVMRLKEVNNILGHNSGDQVLHEMARRLRTIIRDSDTLARLGGDEFAIVLPTMDIDHAVIAAGKIGEAFEAPFLVAETPLGIEIAVGIAMYPDHGDSADVLLQHADIAMRVAKTENTGFFIYDPSDDPFSRRRLRLHGELRQAIHDNALTLYYQPKIDIASGRVVSVEALARWPHPVEQMITPIDFIPMVEQSGLIRPFTNWVLEQAMRQCRVWSERGLALGVAVNISTRNLLDPGLVPGVAALLERYRVPPACISLEVTESAVMTRPENALKVLNQLHQMGLRIVIDDFGTGYSSLAYLKQMPVDELKIDASFVRELSTSEDDAVIVRSTIDLAHNLGLKVVAEGVETVEVLARLRELNCDIAQGYHISRPLAAVELERWLEDARHNVDTAR